MSAVIATEQGYEFLPDAWRPADLWAPREVHVYYLEIDYPPGSQVPGWEPARWAQARKQAQGRLRWLKAPKQTHFRWPRERLFLSSSGAYSRAWLLRWYGATVTVRRSLAVLWPGEADEETEFDASGLPKERVS